MPRRAELFVCPHCHKPIELDDAFLQPITARIEQRFERAAREREEVLAKRESQLEKRETSLNEQVEAEVKTKIKELERTAQQSAREEVSVELRDRANEIKEARVKLRDAEERELQLRKQARDSEEARHRLQVESEQKVEEARAQVAADVRTQVATERELERRQYEERIAGLVGQLEEAQRSAEQGSQTLRGEVQERLLEDLLRQTYPTDEVTPVEPGKAGADVLQRVKTLQGRFVGTILWESKRTKNWSNDWLAKLREDQRRVGAEVAVIASQALPEGIRSFALKEGIIVTSFDFALPVSALIRSQLVELARTKVSATGRLEKEALLYDYVTSTEFRQAAGALAEALVTSMQELERERASLARIWKRREAAIRSGMQTLAQVYGAMQGVVGAALPSIAPLALPGSPDEGSDADDRREDADQGNLDEDSPQGAVDHPTTTREEREEARVEPKSTTGPELADFAEVKCIACKKPVPLSAAELDQVPQFSSVPKRLWFQTPCPHCSVILAIASRDARKSRLFAIRRWHVPGQSGSLDNPRVT